MFYCTTRTLSNSLETVLTLVGLYYWPCLRTSTYSKASIVPRKYGLAAAALACALRPTSAITWIYVGLLELIATRDRLKFIFLETAPIGQVKFTYVYCPISFPVSTVNFVNCMVESQATLGQYWILLNSTEICYGIIMLTLEWYNYGNADTMIQLKNLVPPAYMKLEEGKFRQPKTKSKANYQVLRVAGNCL